MNKGFGFPELFLWLITVWISSTPAHMQSLENVVNFYIYLMRITTTLLILIFLFSCQREKDYKPRVPVPVKKKDLSDFGIRCYVTGDYNGDGVIDTIRESYISQLSNRETPKIRNMESPSLNKELIAISKPKSLLRFSIKSLEPYIVSTDADQAGIYNLTNIGDINNDGGDEFGFRIKWEGTHVEFYRDNSFWYIRFAKVK